MKILLAIPFYSLGTCGLFLLKAVLSLGHVVKVWDYRRSHNPPKGWYDLAICWTTQPIHGKLVHVKKKILLYPDDDNWWAEHDVSRHIDNLKDHYDFVYTLNKIRGFNWLPMGYDPDLHKSMNISHVTYTSFIGTLRDEKRKKFIEDIGRTGTSIDVYGNNWDIWNSKGPVYYDDFVRVVCSSLLVVNQHYSEIGPSTKDIEIAAIGGGLLISDDCPGVRQALPSVPIYKDVDELVDLIVYYKERPLEAKELADKVKSEALKFSYEKQVKKVIAKARESMISGSG